MNLFYGSADEGIQISRMRAWCNLRGFAVVGVVCCLAVVISWWLLPDGGEILAVGVLVSVLIALVVSPVPQPGLRAELPADLETPFLLARDEHAFDRYC